MIFTRRGTIIATTAAVLAGLGIGQAVLQNQADAQGRTVEAPKFEVDPLWPKPMPNHWIFGMVIGVWVDGARTRRLVGSRGAARRKRRRGADWRCAAGRPERHRRVPCPRLLPRDGRLRHPGLRLVACRPHGRHRGRRGTGPHSRHRREL